MLPNAGHNVRVTTPARIINRLLVRQGAFTILVVVMQRADPSREVAESG
jgi:hypothetical protein